MEVKIKKLNPRANIPSYANPGDAAMDVTAIAYEEVITPEGAHYFEYHTGLAFEVPKGYVMLIFPRSSVSNKSFVLANSVGVLDSGYRGELKVRFKPTDENYILYNVGDRVAQIMIIPYPEVKFNEVDTLEDSVRGEGGFGSSGN